MKCPVPLITPGKMPPASVLIVLGTLAALTIAIKAQQPPKSTPATA